MSELTPSFCGVPAESGLSRWSLECAISKRPDPSATIDGRLSLTASVKASTPGPCHWAPSKYTISPVQMEPTLTPPVERLPDSPVPASVRKARYTVPSGPQRHHRRTVVAYRIREGQHSRPVPLGAVEIHHLAGLDGAHAHPAGRAAARQPRARQRA